MHGTSFDRSKMSSAKDKKNLFELKDKGTLCDVQLCLQGSTMLAHACVLASCSSYFLELFQLNQEIHWCSKDPLIIDLETLTADSKNLCVICFSKILNFMYLRELVIAQDHYEHLVAINSIFHIFDSLPLGRNWKKANSSEPVNIELSTKDHLSGPSKITQKNKNDIADLLPKQATHMGSVNSLTTQQAKRIHINNNSVADSLPETDAQSSEVICDSSSTSLTKKLSCLTGETVQNCNNESRKSKLSSDIAVNCKLNSNLENISPLLCSINTSQALIPGNKMNGETDAKETCEFMCCNPEPEINSSQSKVRKRRKMLCELCEFSSVSLRKVLQHLRCTNHLQSSCPICLRKIDNINDLKEHLKDHVDAKPFICQICSKRNRYWDYHKMHLKIHCRNKPFYCNLCQRGFVSKRNLSEHLNSHKGNYLCNKCDYFTSDFNMYRSHLLKHGGGFSKRDSGLDFNLDSNSKADKQKIRKFQCQVCNEGFTQKKNLARHVKLKHFDATQFECSMCAFSNSRIDALSKHMKKKHNCTLLKEKKNWPSKKEPNTNELKSPDFVNVLIPLQLVSDNSVANALAPEDSGRCLTNAINTKGINDDSNSFSSTHVVLHKNQNVEVFLESKVMLDPLKRCKEQNGSFSLPSDFLQDNKRPGEESDNLMTVSSITDSSYNVNSDNTDNNVQVNFMSRSHSLNMALDSSENNFLNPQTDLSMGKDSNPTDRQESILEGNKYIWLNETTGELLSDESFTTRQAKKTTCKGNQKVSETDNSTLEFHDQLKSSVLNETAGECSSFDLRDDNEEWQYPQTPQAGLVGIDDCENFFPWNQIDNSFYSTWVLNETTGELNMVSFFSIQSLKNSTELKLTENSESLAQHEDDDTALFLNEGTGDLSVIYFNPNGPERSDIKMQPCEKLSNDNLETLSEVSDDDSDFLNEEFMRVSANFMSNEENEKFLNELTGEFDIANLSNYRPEVFSNQVTGDESYLNEETGEISGNIMDISVNNDLFTKPDSLEYDLDDSLNCEDFESFFRNGFSTQFCLDDATKNWQSADEASDALVLNECTGELVKKT